MAVTPKVAHLLVAFLDRAGKVISREELLAELLAEVWPDASVNEQSLNWTIHDLRAALGRRNDGQSFIDTLPRRGYRFNATVRKVSSDVPTVEVPPPTTIDAQGRGIIPPVITKAFGMSTIPVNGTSKLTFTIVNRNPTLKLTGVGFSDVLPTGLVISSPPGLVGSWGEGGLNASAGSDRITLSDAQVQTDSFCSFQLDVEATRVGTMDNTTSPVTSKEAGIGNTASATITVVPAPESTVEDPRVRFDQPTIDRFSDGMWSVLNRANQIRISGGRPAVSTLHLITAFLEQPGGQLPDLLEQVGADASALIASAAKSSVEAKQEDWTDLTQRRFPPITEDVRQALVNARNTADAAGSATIEDGHLLYGILSLTKSDNLLVEGLRQKGLTPNMVRLPLASQHGPSTHVARDRWTTNDSLGHYPYAYAIYRFLTDPETKPPLAVSIQAPWGGGKTSLMRMVQQQLDPDSYQKADRTDAALQTDAGKATVGDVRLLLDKISASQATVPPIDQEGPRRITIWFNAWKYESTAQVWAGLADCIVRQIGERLNPIERELFWFRLQLRRLDAGKIRQKIHQELFASLWEKIISLAPVYLVGLGLLIVTTLKGLWLGTGGLIIGESAIAWGQFKRAKSDVDKKPARVSLGEFVHAPDYAANLGFVHEVVEDLKRVFALLPSKDLPMVIFIDDLDRCSPGKIAAVVEAINLFLAGEFPDCIFILGIDDEMVAAALDKAHSEVVSKLPAYTRSSSIGWRFMDKFVQLPFVIPPPAPRDLTRYADSLLSQDSQSSRVGAVVLDRAARAVEQPRDSSITTEEVVKQAADQEKLDPEQQEALKRDVSIIQQMNENIKHFTDKEEKIRNLISRRAQEYFNNPRDMKRFVNLFRFYYFLRAARQARGEAVVSEDQLSRWLVFSLKWPEVVRWIQRHAPPPDGSSDSPLEALENIALTSSNLVAWQQSIGKAFGLKPEQTPWLSDEELYDFFKKEASHEDWKRLSSCDEKGLW